MARRKRKISSSSAALPPQLATANLHAAGIDVGAEEHWAAVPPCADPQPVRRFGANTAALEAVADWLWAWGVTPVAWESTGVYGIPLFEGLETRGFQVLLVDPSTMPRNGRPKTDVPDGPWLQRLHTYGLLAACFRPAEQVVVWRSYLRPRAMLLADAARDLQPMQKALTQMHIKLQHVVSAITGVTGLAIIRAILAGERDPPQLARWRAPRCKQDVAAIAAALQGTWRVAHLFTLQQALERSEFPHRQLAACEARLASHLATCADQSHGVPLPPPVWPAAPPLHPTGVRSQGTPASHDGGRLATDGGDRGDHRFHRDQ